jgi:hypothetical protein
MVDEVVKVTLYPGNTMFIPTGWIHAVVCANIFVVRVVVDVLFSSIHQWMLWFLVGTSCIHITSPLVSTKSCSADV